MSSHYLDLAQLRSSIDALLVSYPELNEDEGLKVDVLEGQTSLPEMLAWAFSEAEEAETLAEALSDQIDARKARKARLERRKDAFRSLIQSLLDRADVKKFVLPHATFSISHRSPAPVVDDEKALPAACLKLTPKADMSLIKQWMEFHDGQPPPGVHIDNGKNVLTIRRT